MGDTTAVNITYKKINYGDQYSRFVVGGTKFQFTSKKVNYCKWRNYCKVYNSHTTYLFTIGKFIFNFTTTTELYSNPSLPGGCMECLLWARGGEVPLGTSPELLEWESSCVEWPESVLVTEPRAKNISSLKFSGWPSYYRTVGKHHKKKKNLAQRKCVAISKLFTDLTWQFSSVADYSGKSQTKILHSGPHWRAVASLRSYRHPPEIQLKTYCICT